MNHNIEKWVQLDETRLSKVSVEKLAQLSETQLSEESKELYAHDLLYEIFEATAVSKLAFTKDKSLTPLFLKLKKRGGWVGDCAEAATIFIEKDYSGVIKELEHCDNPLVRCALIGILTDRRCEEAIPIIIESLLDESGHVRFLAQSELLYRYKKHKLVLKSLDSLAQSLTFPIATTILNTINALEVIKYLGMNATPDNKYVIETLKAVAKNGIRRIKHNLNLKAVIKDRVLYRALNPNLFDRTISYLFFNIKKEAKKALRDIQSRK